MEKQIKSFSEVTKSGQIVLISSPLMAMMNSKTPNPQDLDDVAVCTGIIQVLKYPITENGQKCRSLGRVNGSLQMVKAVDEGCTGNEMINEYHFSSDKFGGAYTFNENDDPTGWNFRLIDETHPKYNPEMAKFGDKFDKMINLIAGAWGDKSGKSEEEIFGDLMGKAFSEGIDDNDMSGMFGKPSPRKKTRKKIDILKDDEKS